MKFLVQIPTTATTTFGFCLTHFISLMQGPQREGKEKENLFCHKENLCGLLECWCEFFLQPCYQTTNRVTAALKGQYCAVHVQVLTVLLNTDSYI